MFFGGLIKLLSKLLFLTGRIDTKNAFEKPLSEAEEKENFLKMKQGDKYAEERLIRHNLRLVAHIVKKFDKRYDITDDLMAKMEANASDSAIRSRFLQFSKPLDSRK